jgi:hypothetical protein
LEFTDISNRRARVIALGVSLAYLAIQLVYISRLPLVMDEFDGAYEAYQLLHRVPYRDFSPYKTVLGYYLQIPPVLLTANPWTGLMLSKIWLALINTAAIFGVTLWAARIFSPAAALTGQLLLVSVTTFLERSSEIRVDMLTAWVGLFSFMLLLRRRWFLAGIVAGTSFLVSQKGIYYVLAANAAAGVFWLVESRDRRTFRDLILMNAGAALVLLAYLAGWSAIAGPQPVIASVFLNPATVALRDIYNLEDHWQRTLARNPLFYWGALAGIVGLASARSRGHVGGTHAMAAAYGAMVFALCRWHRQPWPYFFVILIPTLMIVHVAALDFVFRHRDAAKVVLPVVLLSGIIYPFTYMRGILVRDHSYQRNVIRVAHAMLEPGDTYLAGNDLVYDREQSHPLLRRLGGMHIQAMRTWPQDRVNTLISEVDAARPKLLIVDARLTSLPPAFRSYLDTRFDHTWASISGYAPLVSPREACFDVWFDGTYRIETASGDPVIDGQPISPGTMLRLGRGQHTYAGAAAARLRLIPQGLDALADPAMTKRRPLFPYVYNY